jgi:hypothetical protein
VSEVIAFESFFLMCCFLKGAFVLFLMAIAYSVLCLTMSRECVRVRFVSVLVTQGIMNGELLLAIDRLNSLLTPGRDDV